MSTCKFSIAILFFAAAFGLLAGCSGNGGGSAVTLGGGHSGWQHADCFESGCHQEGHNGASAPYECADCHGDNGAPQGHGAGCGTDLTCHGGEDHGGEAAGFPAPESCETCHGT
jgi:hypothetical protein